MVHTAAKHFRYKIRSFYKENKKKRTNKPTISPTTDDCQTGNSELNPPTQAALARAGWFIQSWLDLARKRRKGEAAKKPPLPVIVCYFWPLYCYSHATHVLNCTQNGGAGALKTKKNNKRVSWYVNMSRPSLRYPSDNPNIFNPSVLLFGIGEAPKNHAHTHPQRYASRFSRPWQVGFVAQQTWMMNYKRFDCLLLFVLLILSLRRRAFFLLRLHIESRSHIDGLLWYSRQQFPARLLLLFSLEGEPRS